MISWWYEEPFVFLSCPDVLWMRINFRKYWCSPPPKCNVPVHQTQTYGMTCLKMCSVGGVHLSFPERNKAASCNLQKHFSLLSIWDINKIQSFVRNIFKKKQTIRGEKGWQFCGNSHNCNYCREKSEAGQRIEEFRPGNKSCQATLVSCDRSHLTFIFIK